MLPLSTLQSLQTPPRRPTPQNTLRGRTDPLSSPAQTPRASPSSAIARRSSLRGRGGVVQGFANLSLSAPARWSGGAGSEEEGGRSGLDAKVNSGGDGSAGLTSGLMLENVFPDLPFARPHGRRGTVSQPFPSTPLALSQTSRAESTQLTSPRSAFAPTSSTFRPTGKVSPLDQTPSQSISFSSSAFKFDSPLSSFSTPNTSFAFSPLALRPSQAKSGLTNITPATLDSDEESFDDPPSPTGYISHSSPFYSHPNEPIEALKWSFPPLHTDSELSTPPGPLSPGEQADVRDSWEDEDDFSVEVELRLGARRESSAFVDEGVPADEEDAVEEDFACGGCGAHKTDAFVRLTPCGHPACPTCMNALVNAAAHKPPRPSNCFACATYVESFEPAVEAVKIENGGGGLVQALFKQLAEEKREREREALKDGFALHYDGDYRSKRRGPLMRRRSSIVATSSNGEARFVDESDGEYTTSPVGYTGASLALETSDEEDETVHSPRNRRSASNVVSPGSMSTRSDDVGVFGPRKSSTSVRSERESVQTDSPASITRGDSDLPSSSTRYNTDWPVVRLDNVPWSVTVKEIEDWLPKGKVLANDVEGEKKATLAVHLLCNRTDGRTLNQAYLECASLAAAQKIVRARDGTYLGSRPVHVSLSSQTELLQTIFPNYTPGFDGLKPVPVRGAKSVPVPLLLQTELTGLLELCKLQAKIGYTQSAHSSKVPERPFFNIVTLLEKMPWEHKYSYNAAAIVRLFNSACAAIEILALVKSRVPRWSYVLRVLFDAIARCQVFRPTQVEKAAELARTAGLDLEKSEVTPSTITFFGHKKQLRTKVAVTPLRSPFGVAGVFDSFQATSTPATDIANFTPSSLAQSCVTTAAKSSLRLSPPSLIPKLPREDPESATTSIPAEQLNARVQPSELASPTRLRRRSSLAEELQLDKNVVDNVAKALGIDLVE
ncbi:hypothetical protein JCM10049v2_006633 [Rhodotorula toruloides]